MFGDTLLLSECSLIVEELKGTSLCFQVSQSSLGTYACNVVWEDLFFQFLFSMIA